MYLFKSKGVTVKRLFEYIWVAFAILQLASLIWWLYTDLVLDTYNPNMVSVLNLSLIITKCIIIWYSSLHLSYIAAIGFNPLFSLTHLDEIKITGLFFKKSGFINFSTYYSRPFRLFFFSIIFPYTLLRFLSPHQEVIKVIFLKIPSLLNGL